MRTHDQRETVASRLVRIVRWQEQNTSQVWLLAGATGLTVGCIDAAIFSPLPGFVYGIVFTIVFGLGRQYRLRKRRETGT